MLRKIGVKLLVSIFALSISLQCASLPAVAGDLVTDGMVAHYTFDEDTKDSSGNGLDAESMGEVTFQEGVPGLGKSARFGNGYAVVKDNDLLDFQKEFSMSAWVRTATDIDKTLQNKDMALIMKPGKLKTSYKVYLFGGLTPYLKINGNYRSGGSEPNKQLALIKEKWYLLTITYNGSKITFYFDGKPITTVPVNAQDAEMPVGEGDLFIGANDKGTEGQNGFMDDLRLYNRALATDEVSTLYTTVMGSPTAAISMQIDKPMMTVNKVQKEIDPGRGTKPIILNGRTVVPISAVIKEIGGTVNWVGSERKVEISYKGKNVNLWIDKFDAEVGGETKTMDTAPVVINGRTMLPLRFVAESLGFQVDWDASKKEIVVRYTP